MSTEPPAPTPPSLSRRAFLYLAGLAAAAPGLFRRAEAAEAAAATSPYSAAQLAEWNALLKEATEFPLFSALYGRRSRRSTISSARC